MTASKKEIENLNSEIQHLEEDTTISDMYLTFRVAEEVFGIGIISVTEIVGMQTITLVPDMPDFVKGVVNLRGQIIPVLDIRLRFNMETRDYDERTCIIVLKIKNVAIGLVVDTVEEVITIEKEHISAPPKIAATKSARYIKGMGKVGNDVKILIDGEKLLMEEELNSLK